MSLILKSFATNELILILNKFFDDFFQHGFVTNINNCVYTLFCPIPGGALKSKRSWKQSRWSSKQSSRGGAPPQFKR